MDALLYLANGLNLLSYFVRDVLCLRVFTTAAVTCLALYFAGRPEPLMEVVYWNLLFVALNVGQLAWIALQRYGPRGPAVMPACQADPAA